MNCDCVIPFTKKNIEILRKNIFYISKNLNPSQIILIGTKECFEEFDSGVDYSLKTKLRFIDENEMISGLSFETVKVLISNRDQYAANRAGWYLQQFLKIGYALICENDYYVCWDADTIPLKPIQMLMDNHPVFDVKNEYHLPYFRTLKRLLGIGKIEERSFISEHMIFSKEKMMSMIGEIESNSTIQGSSFWEKIINATCVVDLMHSGFSEFETYGNFVCDRFPNLYLKRELMTLRNGSGFLGLNPTGEMLDWAAESYDTISFEIYNKPHQDVIDEFENLKLRKTLFEVVEENS